MKQPTMSYAGEEMLKAMKMYKDPVIKIYTISGEKEDM